MSNHNPALIPTPEGVVVPWTNRQLMSVLDREVPPTKCPKCGLLAGWAAMTAEGCCVDCHNDANKAVARLRSYRAA
jgi:hypothetical protein